MDTWDSPGQKGLKTSNIPVGQVVMRTTATILALDPGDVGVYTTTGTLPRNYAYRLAEIRVGINAPGEATLENPEDGMLVTLTENQATLKEFMIYNQAIIGSGVDDLKALQVRNPAVTNDFATFFGPNQRDPGLFTDVLDATKGQSQVVINWVDQAGNTGALGYLAYLRFLMYSVEQLRTGVIWQSYSNVQ